MNAKPLTSRSPAYFDAMYTRSADPWNFESSEYERSKYRQTIDVLGTRRFRRAFEAGCSIGVLTEMLAARCDWLLAVDFSTTALAIAARRCNAIPNVEFELLQLPRDWPSGRRFDLIVLSEILYFLTPQDISEMASLVCGALNQHGLVVLVNYTGEIEEPCDGDEAAAIFMNVISENLIPVRHIREATVRIDVVEKTDLPHTRRVSKFW